MKHKNLSCLILYKLIFLPQYCVAGKSLSLLLSLSLCVGVRVTVQEVGYLFFIVSCHKNIRSCLLLHLQHVALFELGFLGAALLPEVSESVVVVPTERAEVCQHEVHEGDVTCGPGVADLEAGKTYGLERVVLSLNEVGCLVSRQIWIQPN